MELNVAELSPGCYALDTVTFIYFLERHPDFYQKAKTLFQQIETGNLSAIVSALVFAELLVPAFRSGEKSQAEKIIRILSNFPNLRIVPLTNEISVAAARLRAVYGLRTPDAIHGATALASGAKGLITNDRDFLKLTRDEFSVRLFSAA